MKKLIENINTKIDSNEGTWGIDCKDLDTNETWQHNHDLPFTAASVIKVPIMVAAFKAFEDKAFLFSDKMELKREERVGGSGVLQHMAAGTRLSIYDVMTLMIIQSDNTATNMMIDLLGMNFIQRTMNELNLRNSSINNKLMIVSADREGPNLVTAEDMTQLLAGIAGGKVVSEYACNKMMDILKKQQINDCLPANLPDPDNRWTGAPPKWSLAHKTGTVTNITHDVGVFYVGGRTFVASVLSKNIDNRRARRIHMDIGEAIYTYLQGSHPNNVCQS